VNGMPSLLMRYAPEATDAGLTARDQLLALSREPGLALAFEPLRSSNLRQKRNELNEPVDPIEVRLASVEVESTAPELVIWDRLSEWDQGPRRRTLLIPDLSDGHWNDLAQNCDEVLCTPGLAIEAGSRMVTPAVALDPDETVTGIPTDRRMAYAHVQSGRDDLGLMALLDAWFRFPGLAEGVLVISTDSWHDSIRFRIRAARGDALDHTVMIVNDTRPELLDGLVLASDVVVCCHTMTTVGWRPIAMKAALAGKPVISTRCGAIIDHISDCRWVDLPPVNMDGLTPRTLTGSSAEPPKMPVGDYRAIHGMLVSSFGEALGAWIDGGLNPARMVQGPDPQLVSVVMEGM